MHKAVRQTVYMLMRQRQGASGHSRLFAVDTGKEFRLGKLEQNFGRGFAVAETPELAIDHTPRLHDAKVVVVKGIANGVGYVDGAFVHVPTITPVCVMDLTTVSV